MTAIQISAILYLLLAFGVPQPTVDNVQGILERANNTTQSVPLPSVDIGGVGKPSGVQLGNMDNDLKPAYTWDELLQVLFSKIPKILRTGSQSLAENSYPVLIQTASTTATMNWNGPSTTWGDVVFDGKVILNQAGNAVPFEYEGQTFSVGSRIWVSLTNLTPNTTYSYQFIWKESGRADTVIIKTFKTAQQ